MVRKFLIRINVSLLLLIIISSFSSCTSEMNMLEENNNKQINFSVSVPSWKGNDSTASNSVKTETRATPITDTSLGTDKTFGIIADVVDGSNYTTEINQEVVSYNTTNKIWETVADHYWPGANKTVNFYAYYPASIANGTITHTAGTTPTLTYTVPADPSNQIDIITSTGNSVSGNTNSPSLLTFSHIFAAVKFSVGTNGLPSGTIKSITISGIHNSGTYTFGSGWTLDPTISSFTISPSTIITGANGESITSDVYTLMMIPQIFSNATISLVYNNGTMFSTKISGMWNAGDTNIYNISKAIVSDYDYTGDVKMFTALYPGTYKLEVWGAQGGNQTYGNGGEGGKSTGYIHLNINENIYICVGGKGMQNDDGAVNLISGGYNGGGGLYTGQYGSTGGGATHIAITNRGTLMNYLSDQNEVLIVAGGGGGASYWPNAYSTTNGISMPPNSYYNGGSGGGITGESSNGSSSNQNGILSYSGGTQTGPGNGFLLSNSIGGFGYGGKAHGGGCCGGGGGSGWYGGIGGYDNSAGSGGSGYINTNYITNSSMQNGVRSGNGYARITFVSAN